MFTAVFYLQYFNVSLGFKLRHLKFIIYCGIRICNVCKCDVQKLLGCKLGIRGAAEGS